MSAGEFAYFARERGRRILRSYPAALPIGREVEEGEVCPLHDPQPIGPLTGMCLWCHEAAWIEIGEAFVASRETKRGRSRRAEPRVEAQSFEETA